MNREPLVFGGYYHVYNRGVDKRDVFLEDSDFKKFLNAIICIKKRGSAGRTKSQPERVPIVAYCLNPNHFHFVLGHSVKGDISKFMHKLCTSYTKYFNSKYERSGALFEGTFKSSRIDSDAYLCWVTTYVNANAQLHGIVENARNYRWCSYSEYFDHPDRNLCDDSIVRKQFSNALEYDAMTEKQITIMKKNKKLRGLWHQ